MSQIYRLLNNPLYVGLVQNNGELYKGEHEAIVSPEEWHRLQKLMKERSRRPPFFLTARTRSSRGASRSLTGTSRSELSAFNCLLFMPVIRRHRIPFLTIISSTVSCDSSPIRQPL